jgi:hypothetical protein
LEVPGGVRAALKVEIIDLDSNKIRSIPMPLMKITMKGLEGRCFTKNRSAGIPPEQ